MNTVWKDVIGFEGLYEVSNEGFVRNSKGLILKPVNHNTGYTGQSLSINGVQKFYLGHRIVAEAFLPNPNNYRYVNHRNGNKRDNNVNNLEWCTQSHNLQHAYDTGLKPRRTCENNGNSTLKNRHVRHLCRLLMMFPPMHISKKTGVSYSILTGIKNGNNWPEISKLYNFPKCKRHGEYAPCGKLKREHVLKIVEMLKTGLSSVKISKEYNVSKKAILDIRNGKTWSHLTGGPVL